MKNKLKKISSFQMIILGFLSIILIGSLLLMLPISTSANESAGFFDALFTSVSSVCVTGLVVHNTATYWSDFGHAVIIVLIQIGGLGVVSAAAIISLISGKKINLRQRSTMQDAVSASQVGGIVRFTGFILKITLIIELIGAIIMFPAFYNEFGIGKGIWYSVFHSISAFCNAGFDIVSINTEFSSLTAFASNPFINISIMLLIISGGLGFATWDDIKTNRFRLKKYHVQSKVVLVVTAVLIFLPSIYFFFVEFAGWDIPIGKRIFASFFHSVSPRTAGFNTIDLNLMTHGSIVVIIILMIIGGSTGSTAGGIKVTTFAVLVSSAISVFRNKKDTHFFGRRIEDDTIKRASALLLMYLTFLIFGGITISLVEELPLIDCMFETASAINTVGLSTGITPSLSVASKIILMLLMFFGRIGGLTFIFAAFKPKFEDHSRLPLEKINIG